jgi:hypothetical protein
VLSGSISTRPPRNPTPKSYTSNTGAIGPLAKMASLSPTAHNAKQFGAMAGVSPRLTKIPSSSSTGHNVKQFGAVAGGSSPQNSKKAKDKSGRFFPSPTSSPAPSVVTNKEAPIEQDVIHDERSRFLDKILNNKPTSPKASEKPSTTAGTAQVPAKLFEVESETFSQNDTMDSDRQSSTESSLGEEEESETDTATVDSVPNSDAKKEEKVNESSWRSTFDPLIVRVTKTLNIFTCGPLGAFSSGQAGDDLEELETTGSTNASPARRSRHDRSSAVLESRDDTFDDNTTSYTCDDTTTETSGILAKDNDEEHSDFRDPDFGVIESRSSGSSNELLRELGRSETSEGAIQVRSSIRDTMEKIVSKSKKRHPRGSSRHEYRSHNHHHHHNVDQKCSTHEPRQKADEPGIAVVSSKKKPKKATNNSRRTPTKKTDGSSHKSSGKKQSFFFNKKLKEV